jgi:hypothetical protein
MTAKKFKKFLRENPSFKKYILSHVLGDGNCAPRTIATHVYGSEAEWRKVKRNICAFARKHYQDLSELLSMEEDDIIEFAKMDEPQSEMFFQVAAHC